MAGGKLDHWQAGTMAKTINAHTPDFQSDIELTSDTVNVTSGILEGIGPRFGFAPIPGHMDQEAVAANKYPGLMRAEVSFDPFGSAYTRTGIFAIYPLRFGGVGANLPTVSTYYAYVIGYTTTAASGTFIDVLIGSINPNSFISAQSPSIYSGLPPSGPQRYGLVGSGLNGEMIQNATQAAIFALMKIGSLTTYVSSTPFSVSGSEIPMQWIIGLKTTSGGATTAPSLNVQSFGPSGGGHSTAAVGGVPPSFNYGNFPLTPRTAAVFALDGATNFNIDYTVAFTASPSIYVPFYLDDISGTAAVDLSTVTAVKTTAGVTYANTRHVLYNDPALTCNSGFQGVLIAAAGKAIGTIMQDWYRTGTGDLTQYVDLSGMPLEPPSFAATSGYTQDGAVVPTSFVSWPAFVTGTPMAAASHVQLGGPKTGILRANTIYEFTYAMFDKRLNTESNVGHPVKVQVGADDFNSITLFTSNDAANGNYTVGSDLVNAGVAVMPWPGSLTGLSGTMNNFFHFNYLEYRFYYRQFGTQEWLPALFLDVPKYWFYPHWAPMSACTGAIGGLPGGAPGNFNDYSLIPKSNWNCVVMYKNRAFWLSDNTMVFSNLNNVFQYPQRNSVACPVGSFKGAIVQAYYGQAVQDSRLVVFATNATYVGKFTGNLLQVPVQVSTTDIANFGLDGSDFVLDAWTSVTAFSYRAAVVAEGVLYFWGPQGIFQDDGVNPITRISIPLEPNIFNYYDPSSTDAIHCVYNDMTKEVIWFFTPKVSDGYPSHGLVFNRVRNSWLFSKFNGQVDAAQTVRIDTPIGTAGTRVVTYNRATASSTIQRAYFFDHNNRAGDIFPKQELMVKSFTTPSAGVRRLAIAAGHDATNFATIAVGDVIAIQQCGSYASTLTTPTDMLATVAAINTGASTLDITLPAGTSFDASATFATNDLYFPIWHAAGTLGVVTGHGLNGFPYAIASKYWVPGGMAYWAYWLYVHMVFKTNILLPAANSLTTNFTYRSPISDVGAITDVLTIISNSDGNFQVFHPLQVGNENLEGQGLKYTVSGIQIGSGWVLQYLQAFAQQLDGLQLKNFEG